VLRLAADENFNNNIVRGLLRRKPDLDIVRVQDAGLSGRSSSSRCERFSAPSNRRPSGTTRHARDIGARARRT